MRTYFCFTLALCLTVLLCSRGALAQSASFEDLVVSTSYNSGDSFSSDGVMFDVSDFTASNGTITSGNTTVVNPNNAGAGNGMNVNNVNLNVALPGGAATAVGFAYAEFGGNVNLSVNGTLFNTDDFFANDGFSNSEYSISVSNVSNSGFVSVSGLINQFSFGGQELEVDDVRVVGIPEPSTILLSVLGIAGFALVRRRR